MDVLLLILTILQVASASKSRTETMDRVIVNQTLTLSCPIKMIPDGGLLQWLYKAHNSESYTLMCMKVPDATECVKGKGSWLDNIQISTESVEIDRVGPQHSGTYQCKFIDGANFETHQIVVNVLSPPGRPNIHVSPSVIAEGKVVNLTCESSGSNPTPSLKWIWKDFSLKPISKRNIINQTLIQSKYVYGRTILTTFWMPQGVNDGNSISCQAENQLAAVSSNWMYLHVNYPPVIYNFPQSPYYALLGSDVSLECKATQKSVADFKWLSDKDATLSNTPQLTIGSVGKTHEGMYRCVVTNPFGTSSASVNISVLSSPIIDVAKELFVTERQTLTSLCKAIPSFSNVSWWMDDKCINTSSILELRLRGVAPVQLECRATVRLYKYPGHYVLASTKKTVNVWIRYKPRTPSLVVHPGGEHHVGIEATITCIADLKEPGFPKPDYHWRKSNSKWLKNNTNYVSFSSLTFDDAGIYVCSLSNSIGSSDEVRYDLVVQGQPSLADANIQSPSSVKVKEGQSFSISCHFQAYPSPEISWINDGIPVRYYINNSRYSTAMKRTSVNGFRSSLSVSGTLSRSSEVYRCHATNKYGSVHHEFRIQVQYPPKLSSNVLLVAADSRGHAPGHGPVRLNCTVTGSPPMYIAWLRKLPNHNENSIENSTDRHYIVERVHNNVFESVLYVRNFQNEDYGRYFCLAKNSEGQVEIEFEIRKLSLPDPSHDLKLTEQTWSSLTFRWTPGFDGGFKQLFLVSYKPDQQSSPTQLRSDQPNITLTDLLPDTSYTVTISSSNKLGTTLATLSVKVKTKALTVGDDKILSINKDDQFLELTLPSNLSASIFCLTIEEKDGNQDDSSGSWTLMKRCLKEEYNRVAIDNPANQFRVKICLIHLPDVCSSPITNNGGSSDTMLSTKLIGTVAAACTVLVIVLAILLFFILIRTRRLLPGLSDLKDIKRIRKSSKDNFSNHASKPPPSICTSKHGLLMDPGGCPLLNTYSCDPIHLSNAPMEIFNICSTHNIFNEGLYSTLIKSNSINLFSNEVPVFTDSTFVDQSSCYCHNDQQILGLPNHSENNNKSEKIFYEVMV